MIPEIVKFNAKCELARRHFWDYLKLRGPSFYKDDRKYLKEIADSLQSFYYSTDKVLLINAPPRHGKTRTIGEFCTWIFGKNINEKIMTGSYNEELSTTMSKNVRNSIMEIKADPLIPVYSDIFQNVKIKKGDGAMNRWDIQGGFNSYLATSPNGSSTGFGASLLIIDDLIKNASEANNARVLESHWSWFTNTLLSRIEEGGKIIIIMTRWSSKDLSGRVLTWCKEEAIPHKHISLKALRDDGSMLCPEILSKESYNLKISSMGEDIASANYQQIPIDLKGRLYSKFNTYKDLPTNLEGIYSYCDTADTGSDYLCNITFALYQKEAYVLDVIYTKEPMEITEPLLAERLHAFKVNKAYIEANNGGRGFARTIATILLNNHQSNRCIIVPFTQTKNKISRILTNATWVMEHIYFPQDWSRRWPEYFIAMSEYQREGKNAHDDGPDATTGVSEIIIR